VNRPAFESWLTRSLKWITSGEPVITMGPVDRLRLPAVALLVIRVTASAIVVEQTLAVERQVIKYMFEHSINLLQGRCSSWHSRRSACSRRKICNTRSQLGWQGQGVGSVSGCRRLIGHLSGRGGQAIFRDAIAQQPLEPYRSEELQEPGWEPSVAAVRPHRARSSVRSMHLTTYWAIVSKAGPRRVSPSHAGPSSP
jgi:hypothetical protein